MRRLYCVFLARTATTIYELAGQTLAQRLEELCGTRLVAQADCDVDYAEVASG
ncbi:MAG: hypothetical protein ABI351_14400 [Herbaspirillum sp.]